jgi:hypothetical protein
MTLTNILILVAIPVVFGIIWPLATNAIDKRRQEREAAEAEAAKTQAAVAALSE